MQALFRMVYHQGGDILIGGKSIFAVDINCVSSHFGVVPQDRKTDELIPALRSQYVA